MRRRRTGTGDAITLFPFLAVLICTMGSLIVLLVVMVQQAKATAADRSRHRAQPQPQTNPPAESVEQVRLRVQELQWRIDVLRTSREQTAQDLQQREAELRYIEDEIRQLRGRLERAAEEATQVDQLAQQESVGEQASRDELARLREQLDYAREGLAHARDELKNSEPSYALVPYAGPHGTNRRPIFIECTADRVILQPEGVELFSDDFREPLTDDNALAAALRAQREYFADATQNRDDLPYPLIIVRPDGAHAYAAARAAMTSWDAEFGYELVDEQMRLAFPDVDEALVSVVREAVEEARARRRMLQSIAPARFGRRQPLIVASRNGGFVASGDGGGAGVPGANGEPGAGRNSAAPPWGRDPAAGGDGEMPPGAGDGSGSGAAAGTPVGTDGRPGGHSSGAGTSSRKPSDVDAQTAGGPSTGGIVGSGGSGESTGSISGGNRPLAAGQAGDTSDVRGVGTSRSTQTAGPSGTGGSANTAGAAAGTAAGTAAGASGPSSARAGAAGAAGATASSSAGGSLGSPSFASPPDLPSSRGPEWGLPNRAEGATGITRPINIACYADRLVILPEDRRRGRPVELPIDGSLREEVDKLVPKIWERMESWGIAGSRMYWKPVLQVEVREGADERYAELARLLEDSGIVVKRK
jgi:TolA-binding protein